VGPTGSILDQGVVAGSTVEDIQTRPADEKASSVAVSVFTGVDENS
jgi:hypothetical protein